MTRAVAFILAYLFLALAIMGVLLPLVPTTPFLLLAAWFSAKGSEKLHRWLHQHPQFSQLLRDWEKEKAVSRKSKVVAVLMLTLSWIGSAYRMDQPWGPVVIGVILLGVACFLITRPEPRSQEIVEK
ncbi:YbaN family protein [Kiritimatiellota bacterium B12222]|nr:YbaN family protein [Kiritimatiellota bacterium B12222]